MRLVLALACEDANVRPDGRLDVRGVFNQLAAPGFPAAQDRMTAVFVMEWGPEEAGRQPLRADLVEGASRNPVLTIQGHTDVDAAGDGTPAHTRLVMPLEDVVFPVEGRYEFVLEAGGDRVSAFSVFVFAADGAALDGGAPASSRPEHGEGG
ncbi:MAG TPA: hypothetical protein VK837_09095 [Longimicrobiales bacterium]|nr:hypothetical protein [Longimicrobiales bacterium]